MRLLAVDPGIRHCGVALFDDGRLVAAALIKNPCRSGNRAAEAGAVARAVAEWAQNTAEPAMKGASVRIEEVAVEWMRVYADASFRQEDPNDLLPLTGVDAAIAALLPGAKVASYLVTEWKPAGMTKKVNHARAHARLDAREREVWGWLDAEWGSLAHNVRDAIAIGMHHLGRDKRVRVIPT